MSSNLLSGACPAGRRKRTCSYAVRWWEPVHSDRGADDREPASSAIAGGSLGLLLSFLVTSWLAVPLERSSRADAIHLDATVLGFSIGLIFLTTLLAGCCPLSLPLAPVSRGFAGIIPVCWAAAYSRATLRKTLLTGNRTHSLCWFPPALLFQSFLRLRTTT